MRVSWTRFRLCATSAAAGLCASSFALYMILFFVYSSSQPKQPEPALGVIYPLNNHGSHVYLTRIQATGMNLLFVVFPIAFAMAIIALPKELRFFRGMQRWVSFEGRTVRTDLLQPTAAMKAVFFGSVAVWSAIILGLGPYIVAFLVAKGFVLSAG